MPYRSEFELLFGNFQRFVYVNILGKILMVWVLVVRINLQLIHLQSVDMVDQINNFGCICRWVGSEESSERKQQL